MPNQWSAHVNKTNQCAFTNKQCYHFYETKETIIYLQIYMSYKMNGIYSSIHVQIVVQSED